jgi:hypothetical protein
MAGEPVVVARATTSSEAELIVGYLRSAGVRAEVEDAQLATYGTTVGGELRVIVPAEAAEDARDLLYKADHVNAADPASDLDVGLPVDDDVRDYLRWKGDRAQTAVPAPVPAPAPTSASHGLEQVRARGLPVLPLLGLLAFVVALVVLLH